MQKHSVISDRAWKSREGARDFTTATKSRLIDTSLGSQGNMKGGDRKEVGVRAEAQEESNGREYKAHLKNGIPHPQPPPPPPSCSVVFNQPLVDVGID